MALGASGPAKIDIVTGFLGAGKTTFINKVLAGGLGASAAVIENEIGDEAIDDYLVESSGLEVRTLSSGCICCSLKIGFVETIRALVEERSPERIVIEPTGIAGPADVIAACELAAREAPVEVASIVTVVNAVNLDRMLRLRIPAFAKQLEQARMVVLSHVDELDASEVERAVEALSGELNPGVPVVSRPWDGLDTLEVLAVAEACHAGPGEAGDGLPGEGGRAGGRGHVHGKAGFDVVTLAPHAVFGPDEVAALDAMLSDASHGLVLRAKGYLPGPEGGAMAHYEYVCGASSCVGSSYAGQPKLVVIGEGLDREFLAGFVGR